MPHRLIDAGGKREAMTAANHELTDWTYDSHRSVSRAREEAARAWHSRRLVAELTRRNLIVSYKRSVLGVLWTLLHPLLLMGILTLVFAGVFRVDVPRFPLYVLIGLLFWSFFSQATLWAMGDFVFGRSLLGRIHAPGTVFALSAVATSLAHFVLSLPVVLVVGLASGAEITWSLLAVPVGILLGSALALGVALILSVLAGYFADMIEIYRAGILGWMYLTPIFYPLEILPEPARALVWLNPVAAILEIVRAPIHEGRWPDPFVAAIAIATSLATLVVGWVSFTRRIDDLAFRS